MNLAIQLAERRLLSDQLIRKGMRKLLAERLEQIKATPRSSQDWVDSLQARAVAEDTDAANEQHYEIPANYFRDVLGPHLKYSSGYWSDGCTTLEESEAAMLQLSCERAELANGQQILELGCGWGSLSLWMAANYPESQITSVSNSNSQREFIMAQAKERGLQNLNVITCDINKFTPDQTFDRLVSVEMFEHVRNHRQLFHRINQWLNPGAKLFIHVFAHQTQSYLFDEKSAKDWMSKYFFTGGIMPAVDLLPTAADCFTEEQRWQVNGQHYSQTLDAWLDQQDAREPEVLATFKQCYGADAKRWLQRWRMFYMACSELFAYNGGNEWLVMNYRFSKPN
ncbi:MAG: cyclopropane-fatty-acyl-phospholipid synthase family protein [Opitutales bacterium]|jgi:cyclopropane-fatty-acyl-phospholipid synthase|nr:cyclopropane-fatty-acyl-phospholipid synthase family protein [Opitutales bacterium]MDP5080991.1 cyclopropane-fatty-acyl-phospholipid synthase family protein [Opitutales bacterium]